MGHQRMVMPQAHKTPSPMAYWTSSLCLGKGQAGMVEVVWDKRTGHQFACKMIIMHEGLLKQLVCELAFLSGLRHTNMVHFYNVYMLPSNSEVKLMMELCEGKSLATIGEQI
ncbi:hypothetical protein F5148DRAFT_1145777 [Russula earlei]|uniref:Uncharacterized protein n=1 Tax=Russula earlei TaxID=71964 RepID=A0ACC0UMH4_9AGAM|nr:hypothetical protein F5148DRAFT_1145777 [Russula earlei]